MYIFKLLHALPSVIAVKKTHWDGITLTSGLIAAIFSFDFYQLYCIWAQLTVSYEEYFKLIIDLDCSCRLIVITGAMTSPIV